jgi:WD40 repeat protein
MLSRTLQVHKKWVRNVAIFSDSQLIASASTDMTIIISHALTCQVTCTIKDNNAPVTCVAVSKDGTRLASGDTVGSIKVRTIKDGATPTDLFMLQGHTKLVRTLEFAPDDHKIASCSDDGAVLLWDAHSGERLLTYEGHGGHVWCLAWSPDSKLVACAGRGDTIHVVDAATGTQVRELKEGHTGYYVLCLVFGATSDVLYSGGDDDDHAIIEWKLAEGREATVTRKLHGHTNPVAGISVSPCATWMASASSNTTVRVWNLSTGKQIRELEGHTQSVCDVKWSRDGKRIVSGSKDATVRVWEVDVQVRDVRACMCYFFPICLEFA